MGKEIKTVFDVITELSDKRVKFKNGGWVNQLSFDMVNKTIKNGNTYIIKNGKICDRIVLNNGETYELSSLSIVNEEYYSEPYKTIETLYETLKNSVPGLNFKIQNFPFKLNSNDISLSSKKLVSSTNASYNLQTYVMLGAICGLIKWVNDEHFYWKGSNGVIIYKNWITKGR